MRYGSGLIVPPVTVPPPLELDGFLPANQRIVMPGLCL